MFKIKSIFITAIILLVNQASASAVSSSDLINKAVEYDNKEVTYEGEAIGDIMVRSQHAWVNLSDGINAIGIWADRAMLEEIVYTGSFRQKGDIIEAIGTFHRACPEHGGDLDIHARSICKTMPGKHISESLSYNKLRVAAILAFVLSLLLLLNRILFKQRS